MEAFLQRSSAAIKDIAQVDASIHVVLGNESCDLDSVMSSLVLAYFLHKTSSQPGSPAVVPVLSGTRAELRPDVLMLLGRAAVAPDDLLFRHQLDLARLHGDGRLRLTLADHDALTNSDSILEGAVVDIIGHRQPDGDGPSLCPEETCAAMVTERILASTPEVLDRNLALMLYGAMVAEGLNPCPEASRDSPMVQLLERQFPDLPPRGALCRDLLCCRTHLSGLTLEEALLKDKKLVTGGDLRIAVSSVFETLELFLQRRFLQQELCEFCHAHQVGALVVMTIFLDDCRTSQPVRGLVIYSSSSLYRQEISHALLNAQSPSPLLLSAISSPYKDILAYRHDDGPAPLPVLRHFLSRRGGGQVHCGSEEPDERGGCFDQWDDGDLPGPRAALCPALSRRHRQQLPGLDEEGEAEGEGEGEGRPLPLTPMNSLVDGCPLDAWLSQDDLLERVSRLEGGEEEEEEEEEG